MLSVGPTGSSGPRAKSAITQVSRPFWTLCQRRNGCLPTDVTISNWFRETLKDRGIRPCVSGRVSRGKPIKHDKHRYKRRHGIEIILGRLKDWRRVATRYDRCPNADLSALALAATDIFWQ